MDYINPFGVSTSGRPPYVNGNPAAGIQGSIPDVRCWEFPMREILAVIEAAGLSASNGDLTQLLKAIRAIANSGTPSVGSLWHIGSASGGSSSAFTTTLNPDIPAGSTGFFFALPVTTTNTTIGIGANAKTTVDFGLGPKPFVNDATSAFTTTGALPGGAGYVAVCYYDGAYARVINPYSVANSHYGDDTSSTPNQIVVPNLSPPITAYAKYQRHEILLANPITGPGTTVALSGLGTSRVLKRADGSPVQPNDGLAGQILDVIDDGSSLQIVGLQTALTQGRLINTQTFAVAGTYAYTPTPGTRFIIVTVIGAGGGAGGGPYNNGSGAWITAGGGGGGGAAVSRLLSGFAGGVVITVGAKGSGSPTSGQAGSTSSFGNLLSATGGGGTGGAFNANNSPAIQAGGFGGQGSGGNVANYVGQAGNPSFGTAYNNFASGAGGGSLLGFGASPIYSSSAPGNNASVPGTGGSGGATNAASSAQSGGNGADGYVQILEYS